MLTSDSRFKNYMTVWEVKVNEKKTKVTGRGTTGRKANDFDKFSKNGYMNSSWFIEFANADEACKLNKGDRIIIPPDGFSVTGGEEYAEGKYSPVKVTIWKFSYNDAPKNSKSSKPAPQKEDDDEEEF